MEINIKGEEMKKPKRNELLNHTGEFIHIPRKWLWLLCLIPVILLGHYTSLQISTEQTVIIGGQNWYYYGIVLTTFVCFCIIGNVLGGKKFRASLCVGLIDGSILGLIAGLIFGLPLGLIAGFVYGPIIGLITGLICGLVVGFIGGILAGLSNGFLDKNEKYPWERD